MKMLINENDIKSIVGRFIVQLDSDNPDIDITKSPTPEFWLEKRISLVTTIDKFKNEYEGGICVAGLYYNHAKIMKKSEFVEYFNHYYDKDDARDKRFHRLLTSKELCWLFEQMKKNQY